MSSDKHAPRKSIGGFIKVQAREWVGFHRAMVDGVWQRMLVRTSPKRFSGL